VNGKSIKVEKVVTELYALSLN